MLTLDQRADGQTRRVTVSRSDAGWLLKEVFGNSMAQTGAFCGLVYALGLVAIWFAPNTAGKSLNDDD